VRDRHSISRQKLRSSASAARVSFLLRRVFSPRGLDALQNRQTEEDNGAHRDPMRGHMQYHSSPDQAAEQDQEADNINPE
jgi:hypothetical protein